MKLALLKILSKVMTFGMLLLIPGAFALGMAEQFMNPKPSCMLAAMANPDNVPPGCKEDQGAQAARAVFDAEGLREQQILQAMRSAGGSAAQGEEQSPAERLQEALREDKRGNGMILASELGMDDGLSPTEPAPKNVGATALKSKITSKIEWGVSLLGPVVLVFGALLLLWLVLYQFVPAGVLIGNFCAIVVVATSGFWLYSSTYSDDPISCYIKPSMYKEWSPRRHCTVGDAELESRLKRMGQNLLVYDAEIARMEKEFLRNANQQAQKHALRRENKEIAEPRDLRDLRGFRAKDATAVLEIKRELSIRAVPHIEIAVLVFIAGVVGLLYFNLNLLRVRSAGSGGGGLLRKSKKNYGHVLEKNEVKYVTKDEFDSLEYTSYKSFDEALASLEDDAVPQCSYCDQEIPIDELGTVKRVEYFKKRPKDVVGDDIRLGELYYALPVETRTCPNCGHRNRYL